MTQSTTPCTGPQVGAPPSLENVPVARLQVDPAYQRATAGPASRKIIAGMVRQWDWALCQPLVVARRADGSLWILDGQHRHAGATARGDIPFLPCTLLSSLDSPAEARTFVALNTKRQKLSQSDVFHGQLAAGDPSALRVQQLLEDTGWSVKRHSNTASFNAGDLNCAPMLVTRVEQDGDAPVRFALEALRKAWPDKPIRSTATLLKGLMLLFSRIGEGGKADPVAGTTAATLTGVLASRKEDDWILAAGQIRADRLHLPLYHAAALALGRACRGNSPAPAATKPISAIAPRTAQPNDVARILRTSAGISAQDTPQWCAQCEQRKTLAAASQCTSPFCKLKGQS